LDDRAPSRGDCWAPRSDGNAVTTKRWNCSRGRTIWQKAMRKTLRRLPIMRSLCPKADASGRRWRSTNATCRGSHSSTGITPTLLRY
jgi:hypothetical protein